MYDLFFIIFLGDGGNGSDSESVNDIIVVGCAFGPDSGCCVRGVAGTGNEVVSGFKTGDGDYDHVLVVY